jgi:hypothetical protein
MTANLPFVHPAQDPSIETTARARSHVERTIRRRRARRRAVGSAAFAAVALAGTAGALGALGALGVVGGSTDDTDGIQAASEGSVGSRADVDPNTEWSDPVLSADGRRLTIMVGSAPPGDTSCNQNFEHEVVETDRSVTIGFEELPAAPPPAAGDSGVDAVACTATDEPQRFDVDLEAPFGEREVYDGVRPEPQIVHRLAELVDVTTVPDGWTAEEPSIADGKEHWWAQQFSKDGADWYFTVQQEPEADATTPEGTPTPVTVHGIEGLRYSGQLNDTMESIVWVEGGLSITVWGEMQGPPFAHGDQLLQIAEGVQLPTADDG